MATGAQQTFSFSQELVAGVPMTPAYWLGLVTDGGLAENQSVLMQSGIESLEAFSQDYLRSETSGSCTFVLQDLDRLGLGFVRLGGALPSFTFDCGLEPKRYVGAKVASMEVIAREDSVLEVGMAWNSLYVTSGSAGVCSPGATLWLTDQIIVSYGGVPITRLKELSFSVENALTPVYLASRALVSPRGPSRLKEGPAQRKASILCEDALPAVLRGLSPLHSEAGFSVVVLLTDYYTGASAGLLLSGCYVPEQQEPLVAGSEPINFGYHLSFLGLSWS